MRGVWLAVQQVGPAPANQPPDGVGVAPVPAPDPRGAVAAEVDRVREEAVRLDPEAHCAVAAGQLVDPLGHGLPDYSVNRFALDRQIVEPARAVIDHRAGLVLLADRV